MVDGLEYNIDNCFLEKIENNRHQSKIIACRRNSEFIINIILPARDIYWYI